jgi:hypothetical protein
MYDHRQSIKEIVRNALHACHLNAVLDQFRSKRGLHTTHMRHKQIDEIFSEIYSDRVWAGENRRAVVSGPGSEDTATSQMTAQLSGLLHELDCRRLIDIGCGDFNWMQNVRGDFDYVGIDVVPALIASNNENYSSAHRRFLCLDATRSPITPGDIALCREVLFHLSFDDGKLLLENVKRAGFRYVLLTTDNSVWFNSEIRTGDFRPLNLTKAPFRLPPPRRALSDDRVAKGRVVGCWPTADIFGS